MFHNKLIMNLCMVYKAYKWDKTELFDDWIQRSEISVTIWVKLPLFVHFGKIGLGFKYGWLWMKGVNVRFAGGFFRGE